MEALRREGTWKSCPAIDGLRVAPAVLRLALDSRAQALAALHPRNCFAFAIRYTNSRTKHPSTNILLMNQLVRQMFHSGADRNSANLVTTMAICTMETPSVRTNV